MKEVQRMNGDAGLHESREQALVRLVNEYQGMLLRMCYVWLRDEEQARDAVQEAFLKAYRSWDSFRDEGNRKHWLIKIALNTCRSMQRTAWFRWVDRRITPEDLPEPVWQTQEEDAELMSSIMNLPPKLKEVILLYYWQGMTVVEMADSLEVAQSTVSHRLKQARNRLRTMLERRDSCGGTPGEANHSASI